MTQLYYTAPSDEVFDEVKRASMELWEERYPVDKSPFYAEEKIGRIKDLQNVSDNMMYMVAMFDSENQFFLSRKLSTKSRAEIRARMQNGGMPDYLIIF